MFAPALFNRGSSTHRHTSSSGSNYCTHNHSRAIYLDLLVCFERKRGLWVRGAKPSHFPPAQLPTSHLAVDSSKAGSRGEKNAWGGLRSSHLFCSLTRGPAPLFCWADSSRNKRVCWHHVSFEPHLGVNWGLLVQICN